MTFREYNLTMMKHPILGKLLPLECRRTYPRLELEGGSLCASFVGFRLKPVQGGAAASDPAYYLKITYPGCSIRAFVKFRCQEPQARLMTPRTPELLGSLAEACDEVLTRFDERSEHLQEAIDQYNALLDGILEPEQLAVLDRMGQL